MNLDDELKAALRREDPSSGFTQRVLAARVVAQAHSRPARKAAVPRLFWAAAMAAMLVIGLAGLSEYRQNKAERAGHEAVLALRIAAEKLNMARDKVVRREN
jgi:hypothetical protein